MSEAVTSWLLEQGPLGVLLFFVVSALLWAIKRLMDALDERDRIREQHTRELLEAAQREKEEVRASAALASDIKTSLETNTAAIKAVLQHVG